MQFVPIRELSRNTQSVLSSLKRDDEVVVTNNGKPSILLVNLEGLDFVETISRIRRTRLDDTSPQSQHDAFLRFIEAVDAKDDERITGEDFSAFEQRRMSFKKDLDS